MFDGVQLQDEVIFTYILFFRLLLFPFILLIISSNIQIIDPDSHPFANLIAMCMLTMPTKKVKPQNDILLRHDKSYF